MSLIVEDNLITLLMRLWRHISSYRQKQFILVIFLTIITAISEAITIGAVLPFLMVLTDPQKIFNNQIIHPIAVFFGVTSARDIVIILAAGFSLTILVTGILRVALLWSNNQLCCRIGADIGINIYRRTLYQPYSVHVSRNTSKIISGIIIKSNSVVGSVMSPFLTLVSAVFMLLSIIITLLIVNCTVTLIAIFGFGLIYALVIKLTSKRLKENSELTSLSANQAIKVLQEGLGGIRDVLIDASQETYCEIFSLADSRMRFSQANTLFLAQCPRYLIEAIGTVLIVAIACIVFLSSKGIEGFFPIIGALALGAQRMLPLAQQSYACWASISGSQANLRETVELLDQPLPNYVAKMHELSTNFEKEICLKGLSFRYAPETPWILRGIDLSIRKGSRLGIIGNTGSGKSTLLDILMGLLQPTEGHLAIDGVDVEFMNQRSWQSQISHVPQTIYLSDSSVTENIAFGIPPGQINMERVYQAAGWAKIDDVIKNWQDGYSTIIGERGVKISGGQRQRLGIARALYKQSKVLILDEATSALDIKTEATVMQSIAALNNDLTIIIIAHRLTTLAICDEIVEIGDKKILSRGSYTEIIGKV